MNLKVMTYNIQHGLDYLKRLKNERFIDLDKIASVISKCDADIIGLNEVYNDTENKITVEQVKYLAEKLNMKYYYFGKAITIHETIGYGNAIISRYPLESIKVHEIEDPLVKDEKVYYESRSIIECDAIVNNEKIKVFVTHIGLAKTEQNNGINKLISLIKDEKTILMGDFNMQEDDENIIKLSKVIDNSSYLIKGSKFTFPSVDSRIKIDYIFTKNLDVIASNVVNEVASDHFPILNTIKMG